MSDNNGGGFGLVQLAHVLTIVFVIFKLMGSITWSWWFVFMPSIIAVGIPLAIILLLLGVAGVLFLIAAFLK